jgi:hypothetical protein
MPLVLLRKRTSFHPGSFKPMSKKQKSKKPFKGTPTSPLSVGGFTPLERFPQDIQLHMAFSQQSYKERQLSLFSLKSEIQFMKRIRSFKFDIKPMEDQYKLRIYWYNKDQKIRYCFKKLVNAWIYKRYKTRYLNTDDPGTLSPPVKQIVLFDPRTRGTYLFEASTLKRAMEAELGYSNWLFPEPKHPKNPLTNLVLTEGQRIMILYELRKLNMTSWILEAYEECCWNLDAFRQNYYVKLKFIGLEDIIRNPTGEELQELLEEFIEDHYMYHEINYSCHLSILKWAVRYSIADAYMKDWITCFRDYYKLEILHGKPQILNNPELTDPIYDKTALLFENSAELSRLGKKRLLTVPPVVHAILAHS